MEPNKKSTLRLVFVVFGAILFYTALQNTSLITDWISYIGRVLSPIFVGVILAFILNIPLRFFEERVFAALNRKSYKWWNVIRRAVCLILSLVLFLGIVTAFIWLIVPEVKGAIVDFALSLPEHAKSVAAFAEKWIEEFHIPVDIAEIKDMIDLNSLSQGIIEGLSNTGGAVLQTTLSFTTGLIGGVFDFVVGFALSLYILGSKEKLISQAKRVIGAIMPEKFSKRVFSVSSMSADIFANFISGQLIEALIIGVFCYIGMTIFGMPYAVMVSAMISVTALVPVFGAFIGTAFGALMILFVNPLQALGFVAYIIIVQQIDNNFIYPRVVGNSVGLPGIWVLCAVTVGGSMFGALGMLLGVPVCAVVYSLVREFVVNKERTAAKEECVSADACGEDD